MNRINSHIRLSLLTAFSVCLLSCLNACKGNENNRRGTCQIEQVTVVNSDAKEVYEDFQYYNNGLLKEIDYLVIDHEEPRHKSTASIRFFYDDSLRLILTEHFYNQQLGGKYRLKWKGSKLMEMLYDDKSMRDTERHKYIYQADRDEPVQMEAYNNRKKTYHCEYTYDNKGNRTSEVCFAQKSDSSGYYMTKRIDYTYSTERIYPDSYKLSGIHYLWSHGPSVSWPLHSLLLSIKAERFYETGESKVQEMVFTYQQDTHKNLTEIIYSGGGKLVLNYSCK